MESVCEVMRQHSSAVTSHLIRLPNHSVFLDLVGLLSSGDRSWEVVRMGQLPALRQIDDRNFLKANDLPVQGMTFPDSTFARPFR